MRLALVPLGPARGADIPGALGPQFPADFPSTIRWGQASERFHPQGMMLVWVALEEAAAASWAARGLGIVGDRIRWSFVDDGLMRAPVRSALAVKIADRTRSPLSRLKLASIAANVTRTARHDFAAAVREAVAPVEADRLGPRTRGIHALTVLHEDDFGRAAGDLDASTMSDGLGAWSVDSGSWGTTGGGDVTGTDGAWVHDSAAAAVDVQRTSVLMTTASDFYYPACRAQAGAVSGYIAGGGAGRIYEVTAGAYTLLATGAGGILAGDVCSADADADQISLLVNGALHAGPVTDGTWGTGVGGMRGGGNIPTGFLDDFLFEIDSTPAAVPANLSRQIRGPVHNMRVHR